MIFKAQSNFSKTLLSLPESGMGYQIVDAKRLGSYTTSRYIVYNSELIIDYDKNFGLFKRQIVNEGYTKMFGQSDYIVLESPTLVNRSVLSNIRIFSESKMNTKGRHSGGSGAVDNPPIYASGTDIFVRLSAYSEDKRIDFVNMRLKEGTYTTTEADYLSCKINIDDPVDRYALPNDEKINWAFFVIPKSYDKYRPGIVQPANNHNGGGIETLFDKGTSDNTYIERKPY